ncbi:SLAC1 family transporter [Rhizobium alvei]|uniref:C4-dicarboxylate ABC transporter n=1 Tax=Rhizobium alvei TaxID=1132659 RepID=A0ABT8YTJ8_9HYPH|nr:C4-dicarboxylate ABC transporter [Rhizobium alvei]MDO6967092.1 C4-dicarboxylate ABC transporter [Rhizobium alvei]
MTVMSDIGASGHEGLRQSVILQFTPNWFAAAMGTGVVAAVLAQHPAGSVPHMLGFALWLGDAVLFFCFSLAYGLKWMLYPRQAASIFRHPVMSMFLGCIPMALATVGNGFLLYGQGPWGERAVDIAFWIWCLDVLLAFAVAIGVPFAMFTRQSHRLEDMSAVWLLPVVAAGVATVSGALLLPHLASPEMQMQVLILSLLLWSLSLPLALGILVILFLRLVLHKLPPAGMAATAWLALGPIGTGSLGLLLLYSFGPEVLTANGLGAIAPAFGGAALLGGILLWGYGCWWLPMAIAITLHFIRRGMGFNLGWWGFTFPLGVFVLATQKMAALLALPVLGHVGEGLSACLVCIWLLVGCRTLIGAVNRSLFVDPCLM